MAKVTGPLMSIDASGAFADTMVYAKWKGINYSRQYVIPGNPRTANQLQIRDYFTTAVAAWQAEDQAAKDAWNQAASGKPLSALWVQPLCGRICKLQDRQRRGNASVSVPANLIIRAGEKNYK